MQQHAGVGQGMSLVNTWIRHLSIQPLPLLLAVDDSVVAFAERMACLARSTAAPSHPAQDMSPMQHNPNTPGDVGERQNALAPDVVPARLLSGHPHRWHLHKLRKCQSGHTHWSRAEPQTSNWLAACQLSTSLKSNGPRLCRHISLGTGMPAVITIHVQTACVDAGAQSPDVQATVLARSSLPGQDWQPPVSAAGPHARHTETADASPTPGPPAVPEQGLLAEAAAAAAPRLLIQRLEVGRLQLLCEVHVSGGVGGLPFGVDTHRCSPD